MRFNTKQDNNGYVVAILQKKTPEVINEINTDLYLYEFYNIYVKIYFCDIFKKIQHLNKNSISMNVAQPLHDMQTALDGWEVKWFKESLHYNKCKTYTIHIL